MIEHLDIDKKHRVINTELKEDTDQITKLRIKAIILESFLESLSKEITRLHFNDEEDLLRNRLSFNQHLEIQNELDIISKDQKEDLKTMAAIRGIFAHRLMIDDASNREDFRNLVDKLRVTSKLSSQDFSNTEDKFEKSAEKLMSEVEAIYDTQFSKYEKKISKK